MKLNKRLLIESFIVSALIILFGFGWMMGQGMLITMNYVPDIISSYEKVDHLQSSITFGNHDQFGWIETSFGFILLAVAYYGIRILVNRLLRNVRNND
ncbi:hypothetical protein [Paenibacillus antarcticus]|uniref:Uncharacterized protein n=1 Tax=Paenibacillus antarcticus TaxID=253703 RepID=A0A168PWX0_9BACL|nr:hypothetical protein [Paenibacillus antarcticus]OAB47150.1 hypothetical protein PBAT_07675 [Paenibacillus antarcticus]